MTTSTDIKEDPRCGSCCRWRLLGRQSSGGGWPAHLASRKHISLAGSTSHWREAPPLGICLQLTLLNRTRAHLLVQLHPRHNQLPQRRRSCTDNVQSILKGSIGLGDAVDGHYQGIPRILACSFHRTPRIFMSHLLRPPLFLTVQHNEPPSSSDDECQNDTALPDDRLRTLEHNSPSESPFHTAKSHKVNVTGRTFHLTCRPNAFLHPIHYSPPMCGSQDARGRHTSFISADQCLFHPPSARFAHRLAAMTAPVLDALFKAYITRCVLHDLFHHNGHLSWAFVGVVLDHIPIGLARSLH
ncbi:uncharacterized protein J3D65DRAFT_312232 [Phyllosticta citribraziliensis]|uniref:Uncharacterized protein n=1 Tax=Phyllosticta citribraziliensis TaxID=989973 RepID=A0ABR1LTM5_9PEZI